jgi:hypothetical protein
MQFRSRANGIERGQSADVTALSRRPRATAPCATRRPRVPLAYGRFGAFAMDRAPSYPPPLSPSPAPRLGAPPRPGRGPCRPRAAARRAAACTRACRASTWPSRPGLTPPRLALVPVVLRARQKRPGSHSVSRCQYRRHSPLADAAAESCVDG